MARELVAPRSTPAGAIKLEFTSTVLAAVASQQAAVVTLTALCPVIADLAGEGELAALAAMIAT